MPTTPAVSIITPTRGREGYLRAVHGAVMQQTVQDFEWLILDDSSEPSPFFSALSDPRVRYTHDPGTRRTIGEKRNRLAAEAKGPVIAHVDDDDYYAPAYLETMLHHIAGGADLVKLSGWFLYSRPHGAFGYWDLEDLSAIHFVWSPDPMKTVDMRDEAATPAWTGLRLGYGFSYVYRAPLWESIRFTDRSFNEDSIFAHAAVERDATVVLLQDRDGVALHTLHDANTSVCLPQYRLPEFALDAYFPDEARAFLDALDRADAAPRQPA